VWFESFSYTIHFLIKFIFFIVIMSNFNLFTIWLKKYSIFCRNILCFFPFIFIFMFMLSDISVNHLFFYLLVLCDILHQTSYFFVVFNFLPIIFPATLFIIFYFAPYFIYIFHFLNWVLCTFAATSMMNSSSTSFVFSL
jgi:hypothetical protein